MPSQSDYGSIMLNVSRSVKCRARMSSKLIQKDEVLLYIADFSDIPKAFWEREVLRGQAAHCLSVSREILA